MSVLLIGNETSFIKDAVSLLRQEGYKVLTAHTEHDALHLMRTHLVELVLYDTSVSPQNDYEIHRRLKHSFQAEIIHLPINGGSSTPHLGLELGLDHRVVAALQLQELLTQVHAALQQRRRQTTHTHQPSLDEAVRPNSILPWDNPLSSRFKTPTREHTPTSVNAEVHRPKSLPSSTSLWPKLRFLLDYLINLHPTMVAWVYLVALATAEVCTFLIEPRLGLILYGLTLMLLMVNAVLRWEQPIRYLLLSLIFVPLIRILSLSLPLVNLPIIYWYFIIAIPLLTAAFMMVRTLRLAWSEIGLNLQGLPIQVLIAPLGLAFGYIGYQILKPAPLISHFTWGQMVGSALILLISTGFTEELIFRGVMQHAATKIMGNSGIVYIAALYANLHLGHRSPVYVLFVFGLALCFGWVVHKTRSMLGVTLCHTLTNVMLFLFLPFFS
jgi:uncharacterized protein